MTPWTIDPRLLCPWNSPSKNTRVDSHFLLQSICMTQGSNPGLLYYRQILYCLSHQESPRHAGSRNYLTCPKVPSKQWYSYQTEQSKGFDGTNLFADSKDRISLRASLITQWCLTLCRPMDCNPPGFSVHGNFFFRQESWSGLQFPTPKDLPDPKDSEPISCTSYISLQTRLIHYCTALFAFFVAYSTVTFVFFLYDCLIPKQQTGKWCW